MLLTDVQCKEPLMPSYGMITSCTNSYNYNSRCTIVCDREFNITGNSEIECTVAGTWTPTPACLS